MLKIELLNMAIEYSLLVIIYMSLLLVMMLTDYVRNRLWLVGWITCIWLMLFIVIKTLGIL